MSGQLNVFLGRLRAQELLGYTFKDETLLVEACTHASWQDSPSNQRLEFLGDAVLDLLVTVEFVTHYP